MGPEVIRGCRNDIVDEGPARCKILTDVLPSHEERIEKTQSIINRPIESYFIDQLLPILRPRLIVDTNQELPVCIPFRQTTRIISIYDCLNVEGVGLFRIVSTHSRNRSGGTSMTSKAIRAEAGSSHGSGLLAADHSGRARAARAASEEM